jgi:K+-sensing histidine kinase KdpD
MQTKRWIFFLGQFSRSLMAALAVGAITIPLVLIGRKTLGEAVIALLYVVPIVWITMRWGQLPGLSAALSASMMFDFFFIPPFYTFVVGSLESWLVLCIFLGVAIVVVNRIQSVLSKTKEVIFQYELSSALAVARSSDAVARITAKYTQQLLQVQQVRIVFPADESLPEIVVLDPLTTDALVTPDRTFPVVNDKGLVGEIQLWHDYFWEEPFDKDVLLQNFAFQAGRVLGRTRQTELENLAGKPKSAAGKKINP